MKQNKNKTYFKFLEEHKRLVGLSDWSIILVPEPKLDIEDGTIANTGVDEMEQEITITLYKPFYSKTTSQRINILMHELIHSRIAIFNGEVRRTQLHHEEKLTNDLTRGFERIKYGK